MMETFDATDGRAIDPSTSVRSVAMEGVHRAFAQKDHEIIIGEGSDGDGDVDSTTFRLLSLAPSLPPSLRSVIRDGLRAPPSLVTHRPSGRRPTRRGESSSPSLRYFTPFFSSWTFSLPASLPPSLSSIRDPSTSPPLDPSPSLSLIAELLF